MSCETLNWITSVWSGLPFLECWCWSSAAWLVDAGLLGGGSASLWNKYLYSWSVSGSVTCSRNPSTISSSSAVPRPMTSAEVSTCWLHQTECTHEHMALMLIRTGVDTPTLTQQWNGEVLRVEIWTIFPRKCRKTPVPMFRLQKNPTKHNIKNTYGNQMVTSSLRWWQTKHATYKVCQSIEYHVTHSCVSHGTPSVECQKLR